MTEEIRDLIVDLCRYGVVVDIRETTSHNDTVEIFEFNRLKMFGVETKFYVKNRLFLYATDLSRHSKILIEDLSKILSRKIHSSSV